MRSRTTHAAPKEEGSYESLHQAGRRAHTGGRGCGHGCGNDASGRSQAGFTLRIGVVVPFTGASAVFGPAYAKSAGLGVQQANRALRQAGVNDVKLQIEYADDATTPEGGVNAARKLISKGADCILGALTSGSSIAIAQAATVPARVPQIGPNNSSPALTDLADNGYYFRTMPSDTLQAPILARLIREEMGAGKMISLAGRNDAFGTGLLPPLKRALERSGMRIRARSSTTRRLRATTRRQTTSSRGTPMRMSSSTSRRTTRRSARPSSAPAASAAASCSSPAAGRQRSRPSSPRRRSRARAALSRARRPGRRRRRRSTSCSRRHRGRRIGRPSS